MIDKLRNQQLQSWTYTDSMFSLVTLYHSFLNLLMIFTNVKKNLQNVKTLQQINYIRHTKFNVEENILKFMDI